ncbi:MAG: hypothetical protein ACREPG_02680 [Candidatus Binatia bacterium]
MACESNPSSKRTLSCARILCLAVLLLLSALMPVPVSAEDGKVFPPENDGTISLNASAKHSQRGFKKFLYVWPVPDNVLFTGMSGSVSTNASRDSFNEALISVRWIPSGTCPKDGEVYDTYRQIYARYPNTQRLIQFILKKPAGGESTMPVNFTLPLGVPISHCVLVILDGSILTGGTFTMTSKLVLHYTTGTPPSQPLNNEILGDEFCYGMEKGCHQWRTTDNTKSFASFTRPVRVDTELVALHGDISSSTMSPDHIPINRLDMPSGAWSVRNDVYILKDCSKTPRGSAGPGDFYDQLPPDAVNLFSLTMKGRGMESRQQPVHKGFTNVVIPKGGCLAHLVKRTGNGGINSEFQLMAFTRAAQ